jgi:hypothetical protein
MNSPEEKTMRVQSLRRTGRKPGQALFGMAFAMFIVAVAVFGPPLTGQSNVPMIELRHDVLMIDREFEQASVLLDRSLEAVRFRTADVRSAAFGDQTGCGCGYGAFRSYRITR